MQWRVLTCMDLTAWVQPLHIDCRPPIFYREWPTLLKLWNWGRVMLPSWTITNSLTWSRLTQGKWGKPENTHQGLSWGWCVNLLFILWSVCKNLPWVVWKWSSGWLKPDLVIAISRWEPVMAYEYFQTCQPFNFHFQEVITSTSMSKNR